MKRLFFGFIFFSLMLVVSQSNVFAANNRFGIHILDESDLVDAANLVNSNGGEWGYVTFVIREDEMDVNRFTKMFNRLKELKLTPIVRIATIQRSGMWEKPKPEMAEKWADFLGALPWPTKNRYVILFNEPNHLKEWGNEINPEEYAKIARRYWEELKKNSFDFFVLNAGFDAAAPNGKTTMNSMDYFAKMEESDPLIFTLFDGWASHSYPNPGFSGNPSDNGKMTIRGFEWEVNFLKKFYMDPNIPVFITETGWENTGNNQDKIAANYKQAFSEAWNIPQVWAVTPFLLHYDAKPFSLFSWRIPGTVNFYPYYKEVLGLSKTAGDPN